MNADPLYAQFFTSDAVTLQTKQNFVDGIWPVPPQSNCQVKFDAYFDLLHCENDPAYAQEHAVSNYDELIYIIGIVRDNTGSSFIQIVDLVKQRPALNTDTAKVSLSVELAVRLWLMSNIRNRMTSNQSLLQTSIPWTDNETLQSVIAHYVKKQPAAANDKFSEYMNAYDMKRIAGFRFKWTNDLNTHLTSRNSTIYIFHNVSVLERMKESLNFPLPDDYIKETLATIDLLLPFTKASCNSWLKEEIRIEGLDDDILWRSPPNLNKRRYEYWQERLTAIAEAFDRARPRSLLQWLYDTRDMERWWGFWLVAVGIFLTVVFGLIQSITKILQVTKSG